MGGYTWFKLIRFLASFPRPVAYWFGDRGGELSGLFNRPKREAAYDNLRVVLGPGVTESQVRCTVKRCCRSFGKYLAEFFGTETFGGPFIFTHVQLVGARNVDRAVAGGRGAVILGAHLSNWEIGVPTLASRGYDVRLVAQEHADPRVTRLFGRMRAARAYAAIPTKHSFRRCVRLLRQGTSICFGGDRDIGVGGVEVDFFGRPTLFPAGPARIALAAGAAMIPTFVVRQPNRNLIVTTEPPIEPPAGGSRRHKALVMTQRFANVVERYVRAYPEQWGVFDRVWDEGKAAGAAEGDGHNVAPPQRGHL